MCSLYVTTLILGFISGAYMQTCPKEGDIYPCTCKGPHSSMIQVTCSRASFNASYPLKILQQAFRSLIGKKDIVLRFENCDISIPPNFFAGIGIRSLTFESCRVDSFGDDDQMLKGLENDLEGLRISESIFVPQKLNLGHLKRLISVQWFRSNITELGDDWLSFSYSLKYLSITRSNITKIGSYAFHHLINLEELFLKDNNFGPLKRTMFPGKADGLTRLDLDNNALTDLPVDLFNAMPSLKSIFLDGNEITTLDERTWSSIWGQLEKVSLQNNKIVCDDQLKWTSKAKITPNSILGQCSAPKEVKGNSLSIFIRNLMW